jgi:hypothetical protein
MMSHMTIGTRLAGAQHFCAQCVPRGSVMQIPSYGITDHPERKYHTTSIFLFSLLPLVRRKAILEALRVAALLECTP